MSVRPTENVSRGDRSLARGVWEAKKELTATCTGLVLLGSGTKQQKAVPHVILSGQNATIHQAALSVAMTLRQPPSEQMIPSWPAVHLTAFPTAERCWQTCETHFSGSDGFGYCHSLSKCPQPCFQARAQTPPRGHLPAPSNSGCPCPAWDGKAAFSRLPMTVLNHTR